MPSLLDGLLGGGSTDEEADRETREDDAHERLRNRISPDTRGIDDCGATGVAVVNESPDEEPIIVPIARFPLGEDVEPPDHGLVWDLATEAIRATCPAFEGTFVRHYDVQFAFDGDSPFEAEECRRVAVTPVARGECRDDSQAMGTAVVAGGGVAAVGASTSAASCADAGAAAGGGGAC